MPFIIVGGREIEVQEDTEFFGFCNLVNFSDWTKDVAYYFAEKFGLELTNDHWEVINFLQDYYRKRRVSLTIRFLVKEFCKEFGPEKGSSKRLYELFPDGPSRTGCMLAGLPKAYG